MYMCFSPCLVSQRRKLGRLSKSRTIFVKDKRNWQCCTRYPAQEAHRRPNAHGGKHGSCRQWQPAGEKRAKKCVGGQGAGRIHAVRVNKKVEALLEDDIKTRTDECCDKVRQNGLT